MEALHFRESNNPVSFVTLTSSFSPAVWRPFLSSSLPGCLHNFCEAQARVRQGSARDGSQGERPQSLNLSLELTLNLVATFHHHHPKVSIHLLNGLMVAR